MIWKIYALESSRGKNDSCRNIGQYNGFGYAQSTFTWNCFESFEVVVDKVDNWITQRKEEGLSNAQLLCYYNQGLKLNDCPYFRNYLKVI